jgi:hypothetical protein
MGVSGDLSVIPLYCVVDLCDAPGKLQFLPAGLSAIRRESIMKARDGGRGGNLPVRDNECERAAVDWG